jgi:acyl dehydratase
VSASVLDLDGLRNAVGTQIGLSRWVDISQSRIDAFAEVTEDRQFIHVDPQRASQTAFGTTVAHGFLSLSMLSMLAYDALPQIDGQSASINYGFDRLRFISPVARDARIRARFTLSGMERRADGSLLLLIKVQMEISGVEKPALIGDWRILYLF